MKAMLAPLILGAFILAGCSHDPNGAGRTYAGTPGSTYDSGANPALAHGAATYDATSPLTPHDYGNGGSPLPAR